MNEMNKLIESLIKKAESKDTTALQALQYSQAALNAANALDVLAYTDKK